MSHTIEAFREQLQDVQKMTVAEAITKYQELLSQLRQSLHSVSGQQKEQFQQLANAMENDLQKLQQTVIQNRNQRIEELAIVSQLSALKQGLSVNPLSVSTGASSRMETFDTSTQVPAENATLTVKEALQNFQDEATKAINEKWLDQNGNLRSDKFKEGLEYLGELANLSNVIPDSEQFDWLEPHEKTALMQSLPAVHGIIGAIFVNAFFRAGYDFVFNGDNTVNVKSKPHMYRTDASLYDTYINDAIRRNPQIAHVIKTGLLYSDQDLLNYVRLRADSSGNGVTADMQTPKAFLDYLGNPPDRNGKTSDAGIAIRNSRDFFRDINLPLQMQALDILPHMSRDLSVATNAVDVGIQASAQQYNSGAGNSSNAVSGGEAFFNSTIRYVIPDDKTYEEYRRKHGAIGGGLAFLGQNWQAGAKEIFSTGTGTAVALIAIAISLFKLGPIKTLAGIAGLPLIASFATKSVNAFFGESNEANAQKEVPPPTPPQASTEQLQEGYKSVFGNDPEKTKTISELIPHLKNASLSAVLAYLNGNKNVNLTDDQKKLLDDPKNAEVAKRYLETIQQSINSELDQLSSLQGITNNDINDIKNMFAKGSVGWMENWWHATPEQQQALLKSYIEELARRDKQIAEGLKDEKGGIPEGLLNGMGALSVMGVLWLVFSKKKYGLLAKLALVAGGPAGYGALKGGTSIYEKWKANRGGASLASGWSDRVMGRRDMGDVLKDLPTRFQYSTDQEYKEAVTRFLNDADNKLKSGTLSSEEKSVIRKQISVLETRLKEMPKWNEFVNPLRDVDSTTTITMQIRGTKIELSGEDVLKYRSALQTLERYNGVTVYNIGSYGRTRIGGQEVIDKEINDALEKIHEVLKEVANNSSDAAVKGAVKQVLERMTLDNIIPKGVRGNVGISTDEVRKIILGRF